MLKHRFSVALVLLSVLAVASPGMAQARPALHANSESWMVAIWHQTLGAWASSWHQALVHAWDSEGATIDPYGQPAPAPASVEDGASSTGWEGGEKVGPSIDPSGTPTPSTSGEDETERGVMIDPHG